MSDKIIKSTTKKPQIGFNEIRQKTGIILDIGLIKKKMKFFTGDINTNKKQSLTQTSSIAIIIVMERILEKLIDYSLKSVNRSKNGLYIITRKNIISGLCSHDTNGLVSDSVGLKGFFHSYINTFQKYSDYGGRSGITKENIEKKMNAVEKKYNKLVGSVKMGSDGSIKFIQFLMSYVFEEIMRISVCLSEYSEKSRISSKTIEFACIIAFSESLSSELCGTIRYVIKQAGLENVGIDKDNQESHPLQP